MALGSRASRRLSHCSVQMFTTSPHLNQVRLYSREFRALRTVFVYSHETEKAGGHTILQKLHPLTEMSALPPVAVVEVRPQVSPALRLLPLTLKALDSPSGSLSRKPKASVYPISR